MRTINGKGAMGPAPLYSLAELHADQRLLIHEQFVDVMNEQRLANFKKAASLAFELALERLEAVD